MEILLFHMKVITFSCLGCNFSNVLDHMPNVHHNTWAFYNRLKYFLAVSHHRMGYFNVLRYVPHKGLKLNISFISNSYCAHIENLL